MRILNSWQANGLTKGEQMNNDRWQIIAYRENQKPLIIGSMPFNQQLFSILQQAQENKHYQAIVLKRMGETK
ncbi:hypothetical protein [Lonepinella sp. BR2271]|uniref:hypothetical protein n=1 Tax=Lonepinella sp. BR2271 TaxID=3434550 RepID=UPI003F6DCB0B